MQGKAFPAAKPPRPPGQAERETDLAQAVGQELAERHQIGVLAFIQPAPPHHDLVAEIAQMRYRPAKGRQPEFEKGQKHLTGRSGTCLAVHAITYFGNTTSVSPVCW